MPLISYSNADWCCSPCETQELAVELFEYRRKYGVLKDKVRIASMKMPLEDDVLYTEKIYSSEWTHGASRVILIIH